MQAPFLSVFMYLGETEEYKDELAMLIEEFLNQRILGFKNKKGVYITPAFPKLLYVLEEDNIHEDSKYWYLTQLAAKCTAKRLVPDYISEKKMLELKGDCYPCMGCVDGYETITYRFTENVSPVDIFRSRFIENGNNLSETVYFEHAWEEFSEKFPVKHQFDDDNNPNLYIDLEGVEIKDTVLKGFTPCYRIIRNISNNWLHIDFSNGFCITCTTDHPFEINGKGVVKAEDLSIGDKLYAAESGYKLSVIEIEVTGIEKLDRVAYSYDVTTESEHFEVSGIYSHNCRSFPTPDRFTDNPEVKKNLSKAKNYVEGKHKYYGRFNMGVVTINLVDLALSSEKDFDKFWELFEERTELCHRALQCRIDRLSKITSDAAPILWQHGAMARLEPGETLYEIMHHGYSTISLGYAGLYECVKYMTDESHSHGKGKEFGLKVMEALNDKCKQWKAEEDIDYSLYGTPIESTTYKFAKCLQKRFGIIPDITDHTYITNSYHICVREEIDAFEKLSIESEYQALSPGGCISYVETPNMQNNLDAVLSVIKYIYETIVYAELNTKSDYCEVCGYDGEIEIKGEQKKLFWRCPNCGNTDQSKMHVSRRTCGYIGSQFWNQGRTEEIKDRVLHL